MAKYDQFKISRSYPTEDSSGIAELSLLFEEGDNIVAVISEGQDRIDDLVGNDSSSPFLPPSVDAGVLYLQELTRGQVRDICRQYWTIQMIELGAERPDYIEQLRDDIRVARDQSN